MSAKVPLVRLDAAVLSSRERTLFGPIALDLWAGECLCITGPPASGKSLLLEVMAGRHSLSSGRRSYPDFVAWNADGALGVAPRFSVQLVSTEEQRRMSRKVASFHQARWHAQFSEPESVAEQLAANRVFNLNEFEVPPAGLIDAAHDEHCRALARRMGIEHLLLRRLAALSNGELRRVLLTKALLARPRILFLDDPLGGIDPESRPQLVAALAEACDAARNSSRTSAMTSAWRPPGVPLTLVIATPRPEEVASITTRTVELVPARNSVPLRETSVASTGGTRASMSAAPIAEKNAYAAANGKREERLVKLVDASVTVGKTTILKSISFEVRAGEHWLITGPNGSGKSTLLALLLGDHPQSYVADLEILGMRAGPGITRFERQRRIGFMAPELALHYPSGWSVQDVVRSGFMATIGSYSESSDDELQQAHHWMRLLSLDLVEGAAFGRLSEAEQRRTLLARALVRAPRLLFLDEPTQGLSSRERQSIHDLLDGVAASSQTTLLLVSHHPEERPRCLSHHLALREGNIVYRGPLTTP